MRRSTLRILAAALLAAGVCAATGVAGTGRSVNLLTTFKTQLGQIKRASQVPVLLPASLPILDNLKVYPTGGATKTGWDLELAFAPRCGGANACFLASFTADRGRKLPGKANAHLAGEDPAFFQKSTCGASCAPESLSFVHEGVLYGWQDKSVTRADAKAFLVKLANQAVAAGPR
jgi:hypothetical protein